MAGQILLVSGPSGSGKSTLISQLLREFEGTYFSISSTTRAPREGERDGVDYHFISEGEFKEGIKRGDFLEWAQVHGNYYGTSLLPVQEALNSGRAVIFDIDVQGFLLAKKRLAELITSVFITTKNQNELARRLTQRAKDSAAAVQNRLINAASEMQYLPQYDYIIINDDLKKASDELRSIFVSMGRKSHTLDTQAITQNWLKG